MATCLGEQMREKTDQEAQHRHPLSFELVEKMMARVGPKLTKVGFGDLQLEKGGDKTGFSPHCITEGDKIGLEKGGSKGREQTDKGGISPSLEKGFEPKSEKKGAKIGFSGGGAGN